MFVMPGASKFDFKHTVSDSCGNLLVGMKYQYVPGLIKVTRANPVCHSLNIAHPIDAGYLNFTVT